MTRERVRKLTAITLCIIMVLCSLCTIACVTDTRHKNARFFAADFSLVCTKPTQPSLSDSRDMRIVSWVKNPDFTLENEIISGMPDCCGAAFADKLYFFKTEQFKDLYTAIKTISYFLRI